MTREAAALFKPEKFTEFLTAVESYNFVVTSNAATLFVKVFFIIFFMHESYSIMAV